MLTFLDTEASIRNHENIIRVRTWYEHASYVLGIVFEEYLSRDLAAVHNVL